jgi:capsular polysaccharide biosynthesis protein
LPRNPFFYAEPIDPAVARFAGPFSDPSYSNYLSHRMTCSALPQGSVIGASGLVCFDGRVVNDSMHSVDAWRPDSIVAGLDMDRGVRLKHSLPLPGRRLFGEYFCGFSGGWRNHSLWIKESLSRLYLYRWLRMQFPDLCLLVPDYGESRVHARTLELLGLTGPHVTRVAKAEVITPDLLWCAPVIDGWRIPMLCRKAAQDLAEAALSQATGSPEQLSERVYIHRFAGVRRPANFDEMLPVLRDFGFKVISMEALALDDQIRTMKHARYVIAEHGAGVANVIFCRPGARVLEIFNAACPQPAHWTLSSLCGLDYGYLVGRHMPTPQQAVPDWNTDYFIAPDQLARGIRAMIG